MKRVILNIASAPLPETVAAGDELEVQLAPYGDFPGVLEGRTVRQRCDRAAFERLAGNFSGEVLVDFEHKAERGGDTEAAAWVQALRIDLSWAGADLPIDDWRRLLAPTATLPDHFAAPRL